MSEGQKRRKPMLRHQLESLTGLGKQEKRGKSRKGGRGSDRKEGFSYFFLSLSFFRG